MSEVDPKEKFAVPEEVEHWPLTTLREKLVSGQCSTVKSLAGYWIDPAISSALRFASRLLTGEASKEGT